MKLRTKGNPLIIVCIFLLAFATLVMVPSTAWHEPAPVIDSGDDVYKYNLFIPSDNATGDFWDGIDIINITRSGQTITINFQGNFPADPMSNATCFIQIDTNDDDLWDYQLSWSNFAPGPNMVILQINTTGFWWDGTGWTINPLMAASLGSASGNSITSTIPTAAYNLTSGDKYVGISAVFELTYIYQDWAPDFSAPAPNTAPTLTSGNVSPPSGINSTLFNYTVTYTDADNDAPLSVLVWIDGNPEIMDKQDSGDSNFTDGCVYVYSTTLAIGIHDYFFVASDGIDSVMIPGFGNYSGPNVTAAPLNNAPSLSTGTVSPISGTTTTIFSYAVTYTDADNDAPSYIRVIINGTSYNMSKQDSTDNTYTDGCIYGKNLSLSAGTYIYYFEASDGIATARLPSSGSHDGPSVTSDGDGDEDGIPGFTGIFAIVGLIGIIFVVMIFQRKSLLTK